MSDEEKGEPEQMQEGASTEIISVDEAVAANVLERLGPLVAPENLQQVGMIVSQTISQVSHHSGPLPRASELAKYKSIDNSFAERIVRMAEKEQEFRHSIPDKVIKKDFTLKSRGQHYAMAVCFLVIIFASYIAYLGNTDMAGKIAIGTLIGLVSVFVGGRAIDAASRRKEANDSDED